MNTEYHASMDDSQVSPSVRVMHFADVHFGVESYGRFDPSTGLNSRLIDFRNALASSIDQALQGDVELAIFAGDAYKSRDPNQTHQREFAQCLGKLTLAGVPVVLLAGNHDVPNTRGRANAIEIFDSFSHGLLTVIDRPLVKTLTCKGGKIVQIAAVPYLTKSNILTRADMDGKSVKETIEAIVERYETVIALLADEAALKPDLPTIFAGHFTVASAKIGPMQRSYLLNEPEVSKGALDRDEFDYVALGHIHKFQDLNMGRQPPMVYSGSIERIDFGERNEEKGFVIADVARHHTDFSFVRSPTRPFVEIEVDTTRTDIDATAQIVDALAKVDLRNAVVKLSYKVRIEDEGLLDQRRINAALSEAWIKVAVRKELVRAGDDRSAAKTLDALDPLEALDRYLSQRGETISRCLTLKEHAREIMQELLAEEAISST